MGDLGEAKSQQPGQPEHAIRDAVRFEQRLLLESIELQPASSALDAARVGRDACRSVERRQAREILDRLRSDALRISSQFGLRYRSLEAERASVKNRYGICDSDGNIRIRLRHAATGRPLKYSSLVSTLCHELAHLRHFNHGPRFRTLYLRMLEWARAAVIYRPGPEHSSAASVRRNPDKRKTRAAEQLSLFG